MGITTPVKALPWVADGWWKIDDMKEDIKKLTIQDGQILNFITCRGKNVFSKMFLEKGASVVFESSGEVDISVGLKTFQKSIKKLKRRRDIDRTVDEATFELMRDIYKGKYPINIKGIPEGISELRIMNLKKDKLLSLFDTSVYNHLRETNFLIPDSV